MLCRLPSAQNADPDFLAHNAPTPHKESSEAKKCREILGIQLPIEPGGCEPARLLTVAKIGESMVGSMDDLKPLGLSDIFIDEGTMSQRNQLIHVSVDNQAVTDVVKDRNQIIIFQIIVEGFTDRR